MIWATLAYLIILFGDGGLEHYLTDLKGDVKEHVQDKARQELIIDEGKALSGEMETLGKQIDEHFNDLVVVHGEFTSSAADFDEVSAKLKTDQAEAAQLILDARDAMHEQMTKEEWTAIFAKVE